MEVTYDDNVIGAKKIPYTLFKQEKASNTLAVVLPGAGYTTQGPLLHYSTGIFYEKGYDILHINYQYSKEEMTALKEETFTEQVQSVIEKVLSDNNYEKLYLIAKSIGTIPLSYLIKNPLFKHAKLIWFTPLLQRDDVYKALNQSSNKSICFIGSDDPCYVAERFDTIKKNSNLIAHVIEGVNHSLEFDKNIFTSIDVLKTVMKEISSF